MNKENLRSRGTNLALTSTLNKRNIHNELNPFLFNKNIVEDFIKILEKVSMMLHLLVSIEIYLKENHTTVTLKGTNNSIKEMHVASDFLFRRV